MVHRLDFKLASINFEQQRMIILAPQINVGLELDSAIHFEFRIIISSGSIISSWTIILVRINISKASII